MTKSKKLLELVTVTSDLSVGVRAGKIGKESHLGVFYSSMEKLYHVAPYIPFGMPPSVALCGLRAHHWSGTRDIRRITEKPCPKCFDHTHASALACDVVQLFLSLHERRSHD